MTSDKFMLMSDFAIAEIDKVLARKFPLPPAAEVAINSSKPEDQQRWVNNNPDRVLRAQEQGYRFVLDGNGSLITRPSGSDGSTQVLMTTLKIDRNLKRRAGFAKFMARRSPAVQARILRLNTTIEEGARVRGWMPAATARSFCFERRCVSLTEFRKTHTVAEWRALPATVFVKHGKRKYLRSEAFWDSWLMSGTKPTLIFLDEVAS